MAEKKKGFFSKIFDKLDDKMGKESKKKKCCCSGDNNSENESCCKK